MTYDEHQARLRPCHCGRLVSRPEACDLSRVVGWREVRRCSLGEALRRGLWAQPDREACE